MQFAVRLASLPFHLFSHSNAACTGNLRGFSGLDWVCYWMGILFFSWSFLVGSLRPFISFIVSPRYLFCCCVGSSDGGSGIGGQGKPEDLGWWLRVRVRVRVRAEPKTETKTPETKTPKTKTRADAQKMKDSHCQNFRDVISFLPLGFPLSQSTLHSDPRSVQLTCHFILWSYGPHPTTLSRLSCNWSLHLRHDWLTDWMSEWQTQWLMEPELDSFGLFILYFPMRWLAKKRFMHRCWWLIDLPSFVLQEFWSCQLDVSSLHD